MSIIKKKIFEKEYICFVIFIKIKTLLEIRNARFQYN